jgi:DNA-binding GntR family transcriptional regulator
MLLIVEADAATADIAAHIRQAASDPALEIIETTIASGARQAVATPA